MDFNSFLMTVITLFVLLIVGYVAGKRGIVDSVASKKFSSLIISIAQPALIIYSIISQPYYNESELAMAVRPIFSENFKLGLKTLLLGFGVHLFMALVAYLACIRIKKLNERKILEFAMVFGNTGFIGIPILGALFPDKGAFQASFIVISFNILMWTLGMLILGRQRDDVKLTLKKALVNKGTIPSLIGIAVFLIPAIPAFSSFDLAATLPFATESLKYISGLCTPVSMLIIGALISRVSLKRIFTTVKLYYLCLFKLFVTPMLVCLVMKAGSLVFGYSSDWILFAAALTSMPSATSVSMLAELYDISPEFSAQGVGMTSLISIATMPCVILLTQLIISL